MEKPETPATQSNQRNWSELDRAADRYIHDIVVLDPIAATDWGMGDDPSALPDLSPEGFAARAALDERFLAELPNIKLEDEVDRITADALTDRLTLAQQLHAGREDSGELNNIASPLQGVKDAFSLMPTETAGDWGAVFERMRNVPQALKQYARSLAYAAEGGRVAARRQVEIGIRQAATIGTPGSSGAFFEQLGRQCPAGIARQIGEKKIDEAVAEASRSYLWLSGWLKDILLPLAPEEDAVGRERYELFSALFVGARVDLDETYEWGLAELADIVAEQQRIADTLYGSGTPILQAFDNLNADSRYQLHGEAELHAWLQSTGDRAIADLNGKQFDIAPELQVLQARIAPSKEGGVWYTGPSADFSRPGQMWWSIPEGEDVFHTWQEKTTVFHEGIPGHHLQIGQAMYEAGSLNLWRRLGSWNSGHGEGWALYAEQLMKELGYMADPGDHMGMLDAQRLRAARVVLDIGVHLRKQRPDGAGVWDAAYAEAFLADNCAMSQGQRAFELDRYLGWPGQAPSYKIGQRLWVNLRRDYIATRPEGEIYSDSEKKFHTLALSQGSLPMDTLRRAVLGGAA